MPVLKNNIHMRVPEVKAKSEGKITSKECQTADLMKLWHFVWMKWNDIQWHGCRLSINENAQYRFPAIVTKPCAPLCCSSTIRPAQCSELPQACAYPVSSLVWASVAPGVNKTIILIPKIIRSNKQVHVQQAVKPVPGREGALCICNYWVYTYHLVYFRKPIWKVGCKSSLRNNSWQGKKLFGF